MHSYTPGCPVGFKMIYEHIILFMSGVLTKYARIKSAFILEYSYVKSEMCQDQNNHAVVYQYVFLEQYLLSDPCHSLLFQCRELSETVCSVSWRSFEVNQAKNPTRQEQAVGCP